MPRRSIRTDMRSAMRRDIPTSDVRREAQEHWYQQQWAAEQAGLITRARPWGMEAPVPQHYRNMARDWLQSHPNEQLCSFGFPLGHRFWLRDVMGQGRTPAQLAEFIEQNLSAGNPNKEAAALAMMADIQREFGAGKTPGAAGKSPTAGGGLSGLVERVTDTAVNATNTRMARAGVGVTQAADRHWQRDAPKPGPSPVHGKPPAEISAYRHQQKVQGKGPDTRLHTNWKRELSRAAGEIGLGLIQGIVQLGGNLAATGLEVGPLGGLAGVGEGEAPGHAVRRFTEVFSDGVGDLGETALPPSGSPWLSALGEALRCGAEEVPEFLLLRGLGKALPYAEKVAARADELLAPHTQNQFIRGAAKEAVKSAVEPPYSSALRGRTEPGEILEDKVKAVLKGSAKGGLKTVVPGSYPVPGNLDAPADAIKRGAQKLTSRPKKRRG